MAIVEMKSFALYTTESHKAGLLKSLQVFGQAQFKNIEEIPEEEGQKRISKGVAGENAHLYEAELGALESAIAQLEPYVEKRKGLAGMAVDEKEMPFEEFDRFLANFDSSPILKRIKELDEEIAQAKSEAARLASEIEGLQAYKSLDCSPRDLEKFRYAKAFFGTVPKSSYQIFKAALASAFPDSWIEPAAEIKEDVLALAIVPASELDEALAFAKENGFLRTALSFSAVPAEAIASGKKRIEGLRERQAQAEASKKELAGEYNKLRTAADCNASLLEREKIASRFLRTASTLLIEGWVPSGQYGAFVAIVEGECGDDYYLESEDVKRDAEDVPIKLKNNRIVTAFESITQMYSLPQYNEQDPTPILAPFYMASFALMVGDVAYGLMIAIATGFVLLRVKLKPSTRSFLQFFLCLGLATVAAGFLYGSFFGFTFFAPLPTADGGHKPILDAQRDIVFMLGLSVGFGVVHLVFGLIVKAFTAIKNGDFWSAIFDSLFFIIVILDGVALVLNVASILPAFSGVPRESLSKILLYILYAGMAGIGLTAGRTSPSIGGKIGNGLYTVYGLTGYVGDLISYTRIVALMLSGAYIAYSFNMMAGLVWNSGGIGGKIGGILISGFGGILDLGLGALGAYVHTCRLTYVEFFGKFYNGGGTVYEPFQMKNKYITVK
ncbi:MAG: V-type ATP synthase subunit I [Eubacteriaceae bacterium]|jgi:V/A-type H+-transporting ATPase subunit I|nr:V-type ATP synthase subunit I [Eubacteriaceae bacterium]